MRKKQDVKKSNIFRKKKENPLHYVDNVKLYQTLKKYQFDLKEKPETRIPEYVGECIMKIALKLSNHYSFINYSFKEEMISEGVANCIKYLYNYDAEKYSNPFAYFTQIIYYAFIHRIKEEKKYFKTKVKFALSKSMFDETGQIVQDDFLSNVDSKILQEIIDEKK